MDPEGVEWRIGRRWFTGREHLGRGTGDGFRDSWFDVPDIGSFDLGDGLLFSLIALAVVVILIPILFFGAELIVVGVILAAGILTRVFGLKPWVVEAKAVEPAARRVEWQVRGWRKSRRLIGDVAGDLAAGRKPSDRLPSRESHGTPPAQPRRRVT
jgi:hypothetical protein